MRVALDFVFFGTHPGATLTATYIHGGAESTLVVEADRLGAFRALTARTPLGTTVDELIEKATKEYNGFLEPVKRAPGSCAKAEGQVTITDGQLALIHCRSRLDAQMLTFQGL